MIRKFAFLALLFMAVACTACWWMLLESSFASTFSLKELVERNQANSGLSCSAGGGGSSNGIGAGGGGIGGKQSSYSKGESFSCQISDAERFDETKFTQVLKESVEKDLEKSGGKIVSSKNLDVASFFIEYTLGDTTGNIKILGTRSAGYYNWQAQLEEKTE